MNKPRAVTAGRAARWLLLACTLFGLATMHTLGHVGMRMAAHQHGAPSAAVMVAASPECPDGHCDSDGAMNAWSVCLAVLGGLAVIVLLMALLSWAAPRRRARHEPVAASTAPRAPPRRPAGLTTVSTAVLRI